MALDAYMTLKGKVSGDIKGSVTTPGHEGAIRVVAVQHEITSPRDAQSGLPTGRRQHKPFVVTKELDRSSPILYRMLATNETITSLVVKFMASAGPSGATVNDYTVTLTNASIADITFVMPSTVDATLSKSPELDRVSFTYQKIEWTWTEGGISASDDWAA
ncbi:MAG TPA: type VI secretion system tube protein TssD [Acetobacteraceae bacterium]|jgi:type VI secretion system secreted protein Hcp